MLSAAIAARERTVLPDSRKHVKAGYGSVDDDQSSWQSILRRDRKALLQKALWVPSFHRSDCGGDGVP